MPAAVASASLDEHAIDAGFTTPAFIDSIVHPEATTHQHHTQEERRLVASAIFARGHAANNAGAIKVAAELFWEASAILPEKNTSLISYLNMRLKMGDYELCVRCYLRVLESRTLSEKEMTHVRSKLHAANRLMAQTPEEHEAAMRITSVARGVATRCALATRRRHEAAAIMLQRWLLRWLRARGRGPAGLVSQVALLRLHPPSAATTAGSAAPSHASPVPEVVAAEFDSRNDGWLPSLGLAPFAMLTAPWSTPRHPGGPLHFVVASRKGGYLYCCAFALGDTAVAEASPIDVLVVVSCRYQPAALAASARALLPLAQRSGGEDGSCRGHFLAAARLLISHPPPRATGKPSTIYCAAEAISLVVAAYPPVPPHEPWRYAHPSSAPPLPPPPAHVESVCAALWPLREGAIIEAVTALLLERKGVCSYAPLLHAHVLLRSLLPAPCSLTPCPCASYALLILLPVVPRGIPLHVHVLPIPSNPMLHRPSNPLSCPPRVALTWPGA